MNSFEINSHLFLTAANGATYARTSKYDFTARKMIDKFTRLAEDAPLDAIVSSVCPFWMRAFWFPTRSAHTWRWLVSPSGIRGTEFYIVGTCLEMQDGTRETITEVLVIEKNQGEPKKDYCKIEKVRKDEVTPKHWKEIYESDVYWFDRLIEDLLEHYSALYGRAPEWDPRNVIWNQPQREV